MNNFTITCSCGKTWTLKAFYENLNTTILFSQVKDRDLRQIIWLTHTTCGNQEIIEMPLKNSKSE